MQEFQNLPPHLHPDQIIVLYHSYLWIFLIPLLKLTKAKIILQVNEIFYNAGSHKSYIYKALERKMFSIVDAFIISSKEVLPFINISPVNKKIIGEIPGPIIKPLLSSNPSSGNKTRLVYAGIIDSNNKRGAFISIDLAKKLDDSNYQIDIYGYGDNQSLNMLITEIKTNNKISRSKVNFHGSVPPKNLPNILKKYDIGLAIQDRRASFSESSFPSKILTYMSAGLSVIATPTSAVLSWDHKDLIYVYKDKGLDDLKEYIKRFNKYEVNSNNAKNLDYLIKKDIKEGLNDFICGLS